MIKFEEIDDRSARFPARSPSISRTDNYNAAQNS